MGTTTKKAATDRRVGITEAEQITGLHRVSIWRRCRAGKFPAALYIGEKRTWLESELLAWVAEQAARPASARRGAANLQGGRAA